MNRLRSVFRWVPAAVLGVALSFSWVLFFSGGMRAVAGWILLISVGQVLGPLALLLVVVHGVRRRRFSRPMQVALGLALFSLWPALWGFGILPITFPASRETTAPVASVRIPVDGPVRVAWGGDHLEVNYHAATPDQRWAYDLVIEPAGSGSPRLEDYGCYGRPVLAPVEARVHHTTDGEPEQIPGKLPPAIENPNGNSVVLELDTKTYLVIAHLKSGSILVHAGDRVSEGQPIGRCGNSGNTSEPHIHIHHQRQDPKGRPINFAEGLPLYFRDHEGSPMPEGGVETHEGKTVWLGDVVTHLGPQRGS